jgi:hypothetical protein
MVSIEYADDIKNIIKMLDIDNMYYQSENLDKLFNIIESKTFCKIYNKNIICKYIEKNTNNHNNIINLIK